MSVFFFGNLRDEEGNSDVINIDEEKHQSQHFQISIKSSVYGSCDIDKIDNEHWRGKIVSEVLNTSRNVCHKEIFHYHAIQK